MSEQHQGTNGDAHKAYSLRDAEDDVASLDQQVFEQSKSIEKLLAMQERFEQELVTKVATAVASVLENRLSEVSSRLSAIEKTLSGVASSLASLSAQFTVALRKL